MAGSPAANGGTCAGPQAARVSDPEPPAYLEGNAKPEPAVTEMAQLNYTATGSREAPDGPAGQLSHRPSEPGSHTEEQAAAPCRPDGDGGGWAQCTASGSRPPAGGADCSCSAPSCQCAGGSAVGASAVASPPPEDVECRICLMSDGQAMVSPCNCIGSVRYAHLACLIRWCKERVSTRCEICGAQYAPEVLPMVEAEVKAQRRHQQRVAELVRQSMMRAEEEAGAGQPSVTPERSSSWMLLKVLIVLGLTGGLLYAIFFLGSQNGDAMWAAVLLRVVIFVIPVYLVYRGIKACMQYRAHAHNRAPEVPDQRTDRRPAFVAVV